MDNPNYYHRNRDVLLNKSKEYYKNNRERIRNKYKSFIFIIIINIIQHNMV